MNFKEISRRLENLRKRGFVVSKRRGATGIGHTLEKELQLDETNLAIPDIGGRVELKSTRKYSGSLVTLFTFNRAVWKIKQKELILNFGYTDKKGRKSLYKTIYFEKDSKKDLRISIDKNKNTVCLVSDDNTIVAEWNLYTIVGKFISKLERLIIVFAETRKNKKGQEEFHYNEAFYLENPKPENFVAAFENGLIAIDIRMYINEKNVVRNHGTGFRIEERNILNLYEKRKKIL